MAAISRRSAASCLRLAAAELEADAMDGFDDVVAIHSGKFGADIANMAVDGAVRDLDVELIGGIHDLLTAENHRWPRQKCPEDSKLDSGQAKRRARERRDMLFRIDRKSALGKRGGRLGIRSAHGR